MDFLDKLSFLMKRDGYNKNSLSKACGIPYTTIDNWFKRGYDGLQLSTLRKLNDFFNTSLEFWARDDISDPEYGKNNGFEINSLEQQHIKKYRDLDDHGKMMVDFALTEETARMKRDSLTTVETEELWQYDEPVSAGDGTIVGYMSEHKVVKAVSNTYTRKADYIVTVRGSSMEPRFYDNDLILVQETDDIEYGEVGIWYLDGKSYVKQKGHGRLISLNEMYRDVYMQEFSECRCQGRVIGTLDPDWIVE